MNWKKIFAILRLSGKWPLCKLISIICRRVGLIMFPAFFKILGEIPSKPLAFVASKDLMHATKSASLTEGILNLVFCGILCLLVLVSVSVLFHLLSV